MSLASWALAPSSWATAWRESSSISVSPALTSAPSAISTLSTVASKCGRSATVAIDWATPISSTRQGMSLRTIAATMTETGGRWGAAAPMAGAVADAAGPSKSRGQMVVRFMGERPQQRPQRRRQLVDAVGNDGAEARQDEGDRRDASDKPAKSHDPQSPRKDAADARPPRRPLGPIREVRLTSEVKRAFHWRGRPAVAKGWQILTLARERDAMRISGAAAIVTGGGSGLGRATAEALAAKGARVAVFDLNPGAAEEAAQAVGGLALVGDVADEASASAAIARAEAAHGPARILVNCAGIGTATRVVGRDGPHPLARFRAGDPRQSDRLVQHDPPRCGGDERISSRWTASAGSSSRPPRSRPTTARSARRPIRASKGGVVAMTLPIARELARMGVRVNAIAPGIFMTPMLAGLPQAAQDSLGAAVPFPARLGQPAEYAALAVHIVENGYINGETIRIDGALRMAPK